MYSLWKVSVADHKQTGVMGELIKNQEIKANTNFITQALIEAEHKKAVILENLTENVLFLDPFLRIVWANQAAANSVGMPPHKMVGRHCYELWASCGEPCKNCPAMQAMKIGEAQEGDMAINEDLWYNIRSKPVRNQENELAGVVTIMTDITARKHIEDKNSKMIKLLVEYSDTLEEMNNKLMKSNKQLQNEIAHRRQLEEKLSTLAIVDDLTHIYNRRGFFAAAEHQIKLARREGKKHLLFYFDLDDFKEINDEYGHKEGDYALRTAAEVLRQTFRESDIIARLGGDEFVVLAGETSEKTAEIIIRRLSNNFSLINENLNRPYKLKFSLGVVRFNPNRHFSIDSLLADADEEMYNAKREKKELRRKQRPMLTVVS